MPKNNKKIAFIGEFLLSFPGGGEKSIFNELVEQSKTKEVAAYTFDKLYKKGIARKGKLMVKNFGMRYDFKVSRFISLYCLNKNHVYEKLKSLKKELQQCDHVIVQAIFAPLVAKFCIRNKIPYHYYLRDELQLNVFRNYEKGFRSALKELKNLFEYFAIGRYKKLNRIALKNADKIVVNSRFMQKELKKRFGLDSAVRYPFVDKKRLLSIKLDKAEQMYITFIGGGNAMKGYNIVLKIAKKMPEERFLVVGPYARTKVKRNITFLPWQKDILEVYKKTKLLLVPSRWNEAFGRVVVEANLLKIPIITSERGGLPEANRDKNLIIGDLENIDEWIKKIKSETL